MNHTRTAVCTCVLVCLLFPVKVSSQNSTTTPVPVPQILLDLDEYMRIDADCLLPCWHGFSLEEDATENLGESLLAQFGEANVKGPSATSHGFTVPFPLYEPVIEPYAKQFYMAFDIEDEAVTGMALYFEGFTQPHPSGSPNELLDGYSVFNVISAYGPPSEIFIDINVDAPRLLVWLTYDDVPLVLKYQFSFVDFYDDIEDEVLSACLTTENLYTFRLEALDEAKHTEAVTTGKENFTSIDDVTAFDTDSFSEELLENPDLCVDIDHEE